jgi:hypothetical protein
MKSYGGVEVELYLSLTLASDGGEWLSSRPGLYPQEKPPVPME